jgi:hypothetical protein
VKYRVKLFVRSRASFMSNRHGFITDGMIADMIVIITEDMNAVNIDMTVAMIDEMIMMGRDMNVMTMTIGMTTDKSA